jgi:hypothetical protein
MQVKSLTSISFNGEIEHEVESNDVGSDGKYLNSMVGVRFDSLDWTRSYHTSLILLSRPPTLFCRDVREETET